MHRLAVDGHAVTIGPPGVREGVQAAADQREQALRYLLGRGEWDFLMVVFSVLDRAQHDFWADMDPEHPRHDPRYAALTPTVLPGTESLKTTLARVQPYWEDRIAPEILRGRNVLVAAHGNSLRAVVKMLEGISDDEITELNIPTGVPRLYELDAALKPKRAEYLGDPAAIASSMASTTTSLPRSASRCRSGLGGSGQPTQNPPARSAAVMPSSDIV